jgi:hypothetical protein
MTVLRVVLCSGLFVSVGIALAVAQSNQTGDRSAKAAKMAETQRQIDEQLQVRAAERLKRLADYLEHEASAASQEVMMVREAISKGGPDSELDRSLLEVEQGSKSIIIKQAYEDSLSGTRGRMSQPKVVGGSVVTAVDAKTKTYLSVADQLRLVSSSVINDAPDQALSKLGQAHVPVDVQQVLRQPDPPGMARMSPPVREGTPVTSLQLFATGSARVVGTEARGSVDFPAVVAILQDESQDPNPRFAPWCSGTLIAPNVVLSAAHCFCEYDLQQKYTRGVPCKNGKFTLQNGKQVATLDPSFRRVFFQHVGSREIERVEIRDDYDFPTADLSLVFLKEPIWDVTPAEINLTGPVAQGTTSMIVGFGLHSPLDQRGVPIAANAGADLGLKFYVQTTTGPCKPGYETKNLICWNYSNALPQSVRGNTCNGDSGGPLFADLNGQTKLVGVTSGGLASDCGLGDFSFDVEVYAYRAWITQQLQAGASGQAAQGSRPLSPLNQNQGRYYLAKATWQFHPLSQFYGWPLRVPEAVGSVRIAVNTNRVLQAPLRLRLLDDGGNLAVDPQGRPLCDVETEDSATMCEVRNAAGASWRVQASGPGAKWFQIVATGF